MLTSGWQKRHQRFGTVTWRTWHHMNRLCIFRVLEESSILEAGGIDNDIEKRSKYLPPSPPTHRGRNRVACNVPFHSVINITFFLQQAWDKKKSCFWCKSLPKCCSFFSLGKRLASRGRKGGKILQGRLVHHSSCWIQKRSSGKTQKGS